jgi:hypothetical protein
MAQVHWLQETEEYFQINISGQKVSNISMSSLIDIDILGTEFELSIRLEQPFMVCCRGACNSLKPGDKETLSILPSLIGLEADRAIAYRNGRLELRFCDGTILTSEAHPDYEPWTLYASYGLQLVSMPGGQLAVWGPNLPSSEPSEQAN